METALYNIEAHLLTAHERAIFLRLAGMAELIPNMHLDCTPSDFARELKRACEKGMNGANEHAVKQYGTRLK